MISYDAEGAIGLSSAYEGTPESSSASKKSHKMKKAVGNPTAFNLK